MNPRHIMLCLALTVTAAHLVGCRPPSGGSGTSAASRTVRVLAYINVSSGCQQATVDFLQSLPAKYPGVQVELVDFGDGGAGAARWEQSGLKCMALEINGHSIVKFPADGAARVMAFRAPAGLYWTHEDLTAAVQAALQGELKPATEEEFLSGGGTAPSDADLRQYQSQHKPPARQ